MRSFAQRIADLITANLNWRVFVPLFALALATTWYGLFWSVEYFTSLTGGPGFMDMQPLLVADELFAQIREYDEQTRRYYIVWSLFDFAWPFITFTTMLFISGFLFRGAAPRWHDKFWLLVATAYATVLFDWAENIGFIALVLGLPSEPTWLAQATLALHAGKLICNMLFNLLFWVLLLAAIVTGLRNAVGAGARR